MSLKSYMMQRLSESIEGVHFNGDVSEQGGNPKVLSVSLPPHPKSELVLFNLDMAGIAASGGSACTSGSEKASHVLEGIKAAPDRKTVRFSFSKFTQTSEIDVAVKVLGEMYSKKPEPAGT